jgi:hypothetical protein
MQGFDRCGLSVNLVLENQLFQIVKGFEICCFLSNLDTGVPEILGLLSMAIIAHLIAHYILADEALLHACFIQNGWHQVTFAAAAEIETDLLGDALGEVDPGPETALAHVRGIGLDFGGTDAAEDGRFGLGHILTRTSEHPLNDEKIYHKVKVLLAFLNFSKKYLSKSLAFLPIHSLSVCHHHFVYKIFLIMFFSPWRNRTTLFYDFCFFFIMFLLAILFFFL